MRQQRRSPEEFVDTLGIRGRSYLPAELCCTELPQLAPTPAFILYRRVAVAGTSDKILSGFQRVLLSEDKT